MNLLHLRYAVEVARAGSLSRAAENLITAQPNVSRAIRELESELGITIFERTAKGVYLTAKGEEFIGHAKSLLKQMEHLENMYKDDRPIRRKFSVSVPRAGYICDAFVRFSKTVSSRAYELFYKETNSKRTIQNVVDSDYNLGIIRYAENFEKYFETMIEEKGLAHELVSEFSYRLIMSKDSPLASKEQITYADLENYIEIAHADPYVPSVSLSRVQKEELPDNISRRIFVFERSSQMDLLCADPNTFMWVSPTPEDMLSRYGLVSRVCDENKKVYKDVLIYKEGYKPTELDRRFISELKKSREMHIK